MSRRPAVAVWCATVALPLVGLWILLARPALDVRWEQHAAHFWLVLLVALVNVALGFLMTEAAHRRRDARLALVSLAMLASAGFFALHALATPGVLVSGKNAGFVIATPIGLLLAAVFAALSAVGWRPEAAAAIMRRERLLRVALVALLAAWAGVSLAEVGPLDRPLAEHAATPPLLGLAVTGGLLYGFAAVRYYGLYASRPSLMLLTVLSAFALLAEAMIAVAFGHNWHATWWEWHLLMLAAFGLIAHGARVEWRIEGSSAEIFSDLYLEETRGREEEASVLFADLRGFTTFSEHRSPSEVKEMLNAYFRAAAPLVERFGGRIDKTIGDALMVIFRDERHAERAARMGLAFQETMEPIAAAHDGWPRFRVGINTGQVNFGLVDARGGRAYSMTGDTVNTASRLEGQARVGEVVVSEATLRAFRDGADAEPLGELPVKGRERPVSAFVLRRLAPGGEGERGERLGGDEEEAQH